MGNNCIGYFIERFQCFEEIVDWPNFNRIWMDFQRNSGNKARCDRRRISRGDAIGLSGVCPSKDQTRNQTNHQTHNCPTLLPQGWLGQGGFYHQRDRPSKAPLNIVIPPDQPCSNCSAEWLNLLSCSSVSLTLSPNSAIPNKILCCVQALEHGWLHPEGRHRVKASGASP